MPRPVCITYDSTCDLTPQLLERFHIRTIPLTIQSGGSCTPITAGTAPCPKQQRSVQKRSRHFSPRF
mgnify:CR=1 FL=1